MLCQRQQLLLCPSLAAFGIAQVLVFASRCGHHGFPVGIAPRKVGVLVTGGIAPGDVPAAQQLFAVLGVGRKRPVIPR